MRIATWILSKYEALIHWACREIGYDYEAKKALWEIRKAKEQIKKETPRHD